MRPLSWPKHKIAKAGGLAPLAGKVENMRIGKGQNEKLKTELPNGYMVSTVKIGGTWETMVFNKAGDEVHVEENPYKNEAIHAHQRNVCHYCFA